MKVLVPLLLLCLLLTGCSALFSGDYLALTPHTEPPLEGPGPQEDKPPTVSNRTELRGAVLSFVRQWKEEGIILIRSYRGELSTDLAESIRYACEEEPIGAYAVDFADAQIEGNSQQALIRIRIVFRRSAAEIASILTTDSSASARELVLGALENYSPSLTLRIRDYQETDYTALIREHCLLHPALAAIPTVFAEVYPQEGPTRILEIHFSYPESRDELTVKQENLETILNSAAAYVKKGRDDLHRLSLLHRFLTGRFLYTPAEEEPQMPAYDLLCRGRSHSLSFAMVVRAECEAADIPCRLVTGTLNGEPHYWNIVQVDGLYYHTDFTRSLEQSHPELTLFAPGEMALLGYHWIWEDYPSNPEDPEPTEPPAPPEVPEPSVEPRATESVPSEPPASADASLPADSQSPPEESTGAPTEEITEKTENS